MPLNPLDANYKPGRVPDSEAVSLDALLKGNNFSDSDVAKAQSAPADKTDLLNRFQAVMAVEAQFVPGLMPAGRRLLRSELEFVYGQLLDAAQRYWDDAEVVYRNALNAEVLQLRTEYPQTNELFMNIWTERSKQVALDARSAKWANVNTFRGDIRTEYKARYKLGIAPVSTLSVQQQQELAAEKTNITTQLNAWANKRWDAQGCNENGTWGTSAGGSGNTFQVSTVSPKVWTEVSAWWRAKENAYITPSDTSRWSLKKYRIVNDDRSSTINYHINVT
jgi:hypothetical protein